MKLTFVQINMKQVSYSGYLIHINILTSVGVQPTNAVCAKYLHLTSLTITPLRHPIEKGCSSIRIVRRNFIDGLKVKTLVNHRKAI